MLYKMNQDASQIAAQKSFRVGYQANISRSSSIESDISAMKGEIIREESTNDQTFFIQDGEVFFKNPLVNQTFSEEQSNFQLISLPGSIQKKKDLVNSFGKDTMISEFISINNGNLKDFQISESSQHQIASHQQNPEILLAQDDTRQQATTSTTIPKKKPGRRNKSNIAFKKINTKLIDAISNKQKSWKKKIKDFKSKKNIQEEIVMTAKYGFPQLLLFLSYVFPAQFPDMLQDFKQILKEFANNLEQEPQSDAKTHLSQLPPCYFTCIQLFQEGSLIDSVKVIYEKIEGFKQRRHMQDAIKKIVKLQRDLQSINQQ